MIRSSVLRRLGAVAAALATVALLASPAEAVATADPRYDVTWRVQGGSPSPSSTETARGDITAASYVIGTKNIALRFTVRNWTPACTATVPCNVNQTFRGYFTSGNGLRHADVSLARYGTNPNTQGQLGWWNESTDRSDFTCRNGQIRSSANASTNIVTVVVPRACFPKGWRFRSIEGLGIQSWSEGDAWRDGWDWVRKVSIDWTPRP